MKTHTPTPTPTSTSALNWPNNIIGAHGSDIRDSSHSSAGQGFIMFGTKTLKLPFARGKSFLQDFLSSGVHAREEEVTRSISVILQIIVCLPGREFSPRTAPPPTYSFSAFSFLKYGCLCTVDCQIQKWIHQRLAQCSMTLNTACLKYPIWNDTNLDWWEWLSTWGSMQQKIQPIKRTRPQVFLRGGHCNQPLTSPVFWAEDRALTSGDFLSLVPSSKKTDLPQPHLQGNPADNQLLILEVPGPGRERPEREVLL